MFFEPQRVYICYLLFVICYLLFVICYLLPETGLHRTKQAWYTYKHF